MPDPIVKVTGLTPSNVRALDEVFNAETYGHHRPGFVKTTATTATFHRYGPQEVDNVAAVLRVVQTVTASLPKCSARHSLHAVIRKLRRAEEVGQ